MRKKREKISKSRSQQPLPCQAIDHWSEANSPPDADRESRKKQQTRLDYQAERKKWLRAWRSARGVGCVIDSYHCDIACT